MCPTEIRKRRPKDPLVPGSPPKTERIPHIADSKCAPSHILNGQLVVARLVIDS